MDNGSSAGVQLTSIFANQSQFRSSQYGANTGNPGISTFKSRGATPGTLVPVAVGDVIFGITAVGVTGNSSPPGIPLSGLIQIVASSVPTTPVVTGGWIGTDYTLQLVSKNGPSNGRRKVFRINSEGVPQLFEQTTVMSQVQDGTAGLSTFPTLPATTIVVSNQNFSATSRFTLTIQDGAVPLAGVYVSSRVVGTSFTISSIGGVTQPGVVVYWQIWEPVTQTP